MISIELDDELVFGIEYRARFYGVTPEEYLTDLIVHGLLTHQPQIRPELQCPSLTEVEHAMNGVAAEAKRWKNNKSARRLAAARSIMIRLAMACGIYEYPTSAFTEEPT